MRLFRRKHEIIDDSDATPLLIIGDDSEETEEMPDSQTETPTEGTADASDTTSGELSEPVTLDMGELVTEEPAVSVPSETDLNGETPVSSGDEKEEEHVPQPPKVLPPEPRLGETFDAAEPLTIAGEPPIEAVLKRFAAAMHKEDRAQHQDIIDEALKNYLILPRVSSYTRKEVRSREAEIEAILEAILDARTDLDRQQRYRLRYVYLNYAQVRSHTTGLISHFEGSACSVDKYRLLVGHYLEEELRRRKGADESLPAAEFREKDRWRAVQHSALWLQLIDALPYLNYGQPAAYVSALAALETAYGMSAR